MLFDPEFWDRRLAGRGVADPKRKPDVEKLSTRSRIVIPLASKPADYVPGSGPPLQPISLLLPGDSTAYIIERLLLPSPGLARNGRPLPKRMAYLIGWRDLPAASKLVPAMQVLDYVSPRTLEDFEARLEQDLDDEKERLEAELRSDLVAPQKQKKRGRPPAHSQIKSAVVAEPETVVTQAKPRHKKGVMSLSTPKKTRLEEFEWLSDEEGSPSRQIAQEQFQSLHGYLPMDDEISEDIKGGPLPSVLTQVMRNDLQGNVVPSKSKQPSAPPIPASLPKPRKSPALSCAGQASTKAHSLPQQIPPVKQHGQIQQRLWPSSFTPADRIEGLNPPNIVASDESKAVEVSKAVEENKVVEESKAVESSSTAAKPKKSRKRPRSEDEAPKAESQEEKDWVVERIEDVEYYEIDGRGPVRFFRVSWEGDWPPDQKRTWEPEENIPATLVRNFFKTSKNRRKIIAESSTSKHGNSSKGLSKPKQTGPKNGVSKPSSHKQGSLKQSKLMWPGIHRKYRSVSEAFAGDHDSSEMMDEGYAGEQDELNGDGKDEFFVVTEGDENELQNQSHWPTTGALSTALGVFRGFP